MNHLIQISTSVRVYKSFDSDRNLSTDHESFDLDQNFGAGSQIF